MDETALLRKVMARRIPPAPPTIVRVVRYWRLLDAGDHVVKCELCRTDGALELRCSTDTDHPVRTEPVEHPRVALTLAEQWRSEYLHDQAGYREAPNIGAPFHLRPRIVFDQRARRGTQ